MAESCLWEICCRSVDGQHCLQRSAVATQFLRRTRSATRDLTTQLGLSVLCGSFCGEAPSTAPFPSSATSAATFSQSGLSVVSTTGGCRSEPQPVPLASLRAERFEDGSYESQRDVSRLLAHDVATRQQTHRCAVRSHATKAVRHRHRGMHAVVESVRQNRSAQLYELNTSISGVDMIQQS